jgi:hypothetical protein
VGEAGLETQPQRLFIHKSEHEDLAGFGVAGDAGQSAVLVELRRQLGAFFDLLDGKTREKSVVMSGFSKL